MGLFASPVTWIGFQETLTVSEVNTELSTEPVNSSESPEADPSVEDVFAGTRSGAQTGNVRR